MSNPRLFTALSILLCAPLLAAQLADHAESLVIGPGDLLHIQFYDTPELEQHPRVEDAGAAPLLFLGPVYLAGKTPQQAARLIESLMISRHFMSHPQVLLTVGQYATQEVTINGEVVHPGSYPITTPRSVLDLLSLAGGLNPIADRHIVIQHRSSPTKPTLHFVSNDPAQQLLDDVMIAPGDVILVPRVGMAYILGDVGRPGGYPLASNTSGLTLLQLIATAGSLNKTAVISGIRLMRHVGVSYSQVPIDMHRIERGEDPDPLLLPDDVIIVPFSYTKNFLLNGTSIAASVSSAVIYSH